MTGTFDDWTKSEKLDKVGEHFEKNVQLSDASKKIYYKVRRSYILAGPSYPFRNLPFSQFRNFTISQFLLVTPTHTACSAAKKLAIPSSFVIIVVSATEASEVVILQRQRQRQRRYIRNPNLPRA